ncbi:hypothetical protein O9992_04105 [Vibrio lentus]|nr:hypothetical protein [Vibrio lentus]
MTTHFAYIVAALEAGLPAGFGIAAAFKGEELNNGIRKQTQDSYSLLLVNTGMIQLVSNWVTQPT